MLCLLVKSVMHSIQGGACCHSSMCRSVLPGPQQVLNDDTCLLTVANGKRRRHAMAADLVEAAHALRALAPRLPQVTAALQRSMQVADAYIKVWLLAPTLPLSARATFAASTKVRC